MAIRSFIEIWMGKVNWECLDFSYRNTDYSCRYTLTTSKWLGKCRIWHPRGKINDVDIDEPTSFFDHVYLGCIQRACKPNETVIEQDTKMFESRISAGATWKIPGWEKTSRKNNCMVLWCGRTRQKSAWRDCVLANKKVEQLHKVSSPCLDDHQFKKEELESVGEYLKYAHKLYWNACTWHEMDDLTFPGQSTNWFVQSRNGLKHVTDVWQGLFRTVIILKTDNIVMCITRHSIVDWDCSKTWTLLVIWKTQINVKRNLIFIRKSNSCSCELVV